MNLSSFSNKVNNQIPSEIISNILPTEQCEINIDIDELNKEIQTKMNQSDQSDKSDQSDNTTNESISNKIEPECS